MLMRTIFAVVCLSAGSVVAARACGGGSSRGPDSRHPSSPNAELSSAATTSSRTSPPNKSLEPPRGTRWNRRSALGTNLASFTEWSTEIPLVDQFKLSRRWTSGTEEEFDDQRPLDVDQHGWVRRLKPRQIARSLMLWGIKHYRPGRFVVRYEGKGEIRYHENSANRFIRSESKPGRHVIDVRPERSNEGILLEIHRSDPADYIRNIRVYPPGGACSKRASRWCDSAHPCGSEGQCQSFEELGRKQVFHPDFLDRIKTYSVLRFMDFMNTNDSAVAHWSDRPKVTDATWTPRGAPIEIMVELANLVSADPWFTMPHQADDDYIERFAREVRSSLRPGLRAWIEYSNEVWNGQFAQAQYSVEQGQRLGIGEGDVGAGLSFYARRSSEMFRIWERAWGGSEGLVRVLAAQSGNAWIAGQIASFEQVGERADALAIAPYFGISADMKEAKRVRRMSVDDLISETRSKIFPEVARQIRTNKEVAQKYELPLVAYEGGQHFVGVMGAENDEKLNQLFDEFNRSPKIKKLYADYLQLWREGGGTWFMHFVNCDGWSKWGRWGALEYASQPRAEAPKFDALQEFIVRHPRWW